jgi:hypothetical protein
MRHRGSFPQPRPVAALTFRVAQATVLAALVPGSCGPQAPPARARRTLLSTVTLATVTV